MAKTITVDLELKYKEAVKDLDEFQKEYEQLQKEVQKENKKTAESTKELGAAADKATGGMISSFKGVVSSVGGVVRSLGTLQGALIATGIGAFVLVVTSLISAFKSSEEGQDRFAKLMGQIGVVVGNVKDVIANFGEGLLNLGGVFKKFFAGDFKGALEEGKNAFKGLTDSIKNFGDETRAELKVADEIAAKIAKANKVERELVIARAKANRDIANLREQSVNKEQFSAEQRVKFLEEASAIELRITQREIEAAKLRRDAKIAENSLSKSTKEDLDEEARLQAEVINLETARISKQRELTSQIIAFKAEINALNTADAKSAEDGVAFVEEQGIQWGLYVDIAEEALNEELELSLEANKQRIEDAKVTAQALQDIRMSEIDNIGAGFALIGQLAGKNKALQAAALIGESAAGIAKIVISTQAANAAARLKYAAIPGGLALAAAEISANKISAGIGIASNIAATAKGIAGLKASGNASRGANNLDSGGAGSAAPTPPSFNVVGASATNQLAEAISGQNQKPLKAFVVSSEVSTAQSLERNIVQGASI